MRIAGGKNKGRRIKVSKKGIRPTKGVVREAIFNVLSKRIQDADVLDVFAGSGALGLEAVSRGASSCVFIENNAKTLMKNIKNLAASSRIKTIKDDFRVGLRRLRKKEFDIIFLDPPYHGNYIEKTTRLILLYNLLKNKGMIVAEHHSSEELILPDGLLILKRKNYGDTAVTFIAPNKNEERTPSV